MPSKIAIAYQMKKKAKKANKGDKDAPEKGVHKENPYRRGESEAGVDYRASKEHSGYLGSKEYVKKTAKEGHRQVLSELKSDKGDRRNLASGGMVDSGDPEMNYAKGGKIKEKHMRTLSRLERGGHGYGPEGRERMRDKQAMSDYKMTQGAGRKAFNKEEHRWKLDEIKEQKGPKSGKSGFAEGGVVDCPSCGMAHGGSVVDRAACKKMSRGGVVANDTSDDLAGFHDNQFDYLVESGGLSDDSGPGNEIGGPDEDDLVARAMLRRKAKR